MTDFPSTRRLLTAGAAIFLSVQISLTPAFAELRAVPSDTIVAAGQSFVLQLETDTAKPGSGPDLSPLNKDFDILGTGQSTRTNIINGARTDTTGWAITLAPKSRGKLTIPSISLGREHSRPVTIDVVDAAQLPATSNAAPVRIEMKTDGNAHYVQEEIPVTVRIVTGTNLREAALEAPSGKGFILTRHGEDKISRSVQNGREVTIIERQYLLKPQTSGQLTIPPIVLKGLVSDASARRSPFGSDRFDSLFGSSLFSNDFFNDMMNPGQQVVLRSQPLTLDIKARPGQGDGWFLPAKQVQLQSEWNPAKPVFKVGEAVTRTIRVFALGASKEQLPDIDVTRAEGARIYIDQTRDKTIDTKDGTAAVREYTTSVVPTREGEIVLPAIEVKWWDTQADVERVAKLPVETWKTPGAASAMTASDTLDRATTPNPESAFIEQESQMRWEWLLLAVTLLLVAGLSIGVLLRRRLRLSRPTSNSAALASTAARVKLQSANIRKRSLDKTEKTLIVACSANDLTGAYAALLAWLRSAGDAKPLERKDIARAAPKIADHLAEMEKAVYSGAPMDGWQGRHLLADFKASKDALANGGRRKAKTRILPPLYPDESDTRRAA